MACLNHMYLPIASQAEADILGEPLVRTTRANMAMRLLSPVSRLGP